jgi:hypothetical protein
VNKLNEYQSEAFKNADKVIVDLTDTLIKGKALYGAVLVLKDKLKKGRFKDAAKLALGAGRIYVASHLTGKSKSPYDHWDLDNRFLEDVYLCLDHAHVEKRELDGAIEKYLGLRFIQNNGKEFVSKAMNYGGKKKKMVLLTREAENSADAAKKIYGFDIALSNNVKYRGPNMAINDANIIIKEPEDKLKVLEDKVGDISTAVVVSSNPEDTEVYRGKIGILLTSIPKL